jgi:hypothetical protein
LAFGQRRKSVSRAITPGGRRPAGPIVFGMENTDVADFSIHHLLVGWGYGQPALVWSDF